MNRNVLSCITLTEIPQWEACNISGGFTSFAYDVATSLRAWSQALNQNYNGLVKTAFSWFSQQ